MRVKVRLTIIGEGELFVPTYILTWNSEDTPLDELADEAEKTAQGISITRDWSTGNTKRIQPGDRLFLLKQGPLPRGIIGVGEATSDVYRGPHWSGERGKEANYVDLDVERLLDPAVNDPLSTENFEGALGKVSWRIQASGVSIPDDAAEQLEAAWAEHVLQADGVKNEGVEEVEEEAFREGRELYRLHRTRERDPLLVKKAKARAMQQYGRLFCCVCKFDFAARYGPIGEGFIECHHTKPLSELEAETITKVSDLALVCSNCHRMIHRKQPWLLKNQLSKLLKI
jgi:5-methylcytosine-specific restriction protein A